MIRLVFFFLLLSISTILHAQSVLVSEDFRLGSPFNEPDGRNDVVRINDTDFITLAKSKGSQTGSSEFVLERYNEKLASVWQTPLEVEGHEDYKELFFNGNIVILSIIRDEDKHVTKLEAYGFDPQNGKKQWTKELESYNVGEWEYHNHKGRVKESFIDVICEHANSDFVTPFEYKHNIRFSPDASKFVSYVYDYSQFKLKAHVRVYDNTGELLQQGEVPIDDDYTNYGIYVNNKGLIYIVNGGRLGQLNLIQYNLADKSFKLMELPATNMFKDDYHLHFIADDIVYIGNEETRDGKLMGVMVTKFDFSTEKRENVVLHDLSPEFKKRILSIRDNDKDIHGEEDWKDYDITHFIVNDDGSILVSLEKRSLYADGYPHVSRDVYDVTHKVEFNGHVHTEGIILLSFDKEGALRWNNYIPKNQVYPSNDGLNTISYVLDNAHPEEIRILYAYSHGAAGIMNELDLIKINRTTGEMTAPIELPNDDKLTLVRDYTIFKDHKTLIVVGKKGLLGKKSKIVKYEIH